MAEKMLKTKAFMGANVFMSRKLVPPEVFDALHDALSLNGAAVFLCCDPSRNGPNDYHIISSPNHEKFEDLKAKGCNLLGPQCVLSCAKEHKALPKQGFACCLAMDGVKVLASGFDVDEKVKIEKMVTAMGGQLLTRAAVDASFVVVKNVLAAKYKWALNVLKKPVVTVNWLYQCWTEHRVVPQESYKVPPFSGLVICVTRIPAGERKEIEKSIAQNGGIYSAELTKACTHLICDAPEGDKYKVARRWGHIHIVTRKWFQQSVVRRTCLDEDSYPVQGSSLSSNKTVKSSSVVQHSQGKAAENSSSVQTSVADSSLSCHPCAGFSDPDLETTLSQNMSSMFSDPYVSVKELPDEMPVAQPNNETRVDNCVADDSQSEDDLYLSECRISLVGFDAGELRKLINIVRRGGGSRSTSFNVKLTHIVVGAPTEIEKKELRSLAASGVIHIVRPAWLEDCDREKKEVPIARQHIAYDLLLPKDSMVSDKGLAAGTHGNSQGKISCIKSPSHPGKFVGSESLGDGMVSSLEQGGEVDPKIDTSASANVRQSQQNLFSVNGQRKGGNKMLHNSSIQNQKAMNVFKGKSFCFSSSFPEDKRAEIVEWVIQGGGEMVEDHAIQSVHFVIECHGVVPRSMDITKTTSVSSHWVRSCLEDGQLLDVRGHIIYSPLPCLIPFPGFENFRFCTSQYEEKDKKLLRNLCFILGAKFVEKLTRKVTHLLCKFTEGPKYEAACEWGLCSITSEWIYECVRQNKVVAIDGFQPKEVTSQDQGAGSYMFSQVTGMISGDSSQFVSQSQDLRSSITRTYSGRINSFAKEGQKPVDYSKKARLLEISDRKVLLSSAVNQTRSRRINSSAEEAQKPIDCSKKARLLETGEDKVLLSSGVAQNSSRRINSSAEEAEKPSGYSKKERLLETTDKQVSLERLMETEEFLSSGDHLDNPIGNTDSFDDNNSNNTEPSRSDVAAVIEAILEQTSEIHDQQSPGKTGSDKNLYSSNPILHEEHGGSHSVIGLPNHWLNRTGKRDEPSNSARDIKKGGDGFSETQTESQVVVYEEDLTGRQMLIDRVRTRSSLT